MEERKKEKNGWWEQNGTMVISAAIVMMFMILSVYEVNTTMKAVTEISAQNAEEMHKAVDAINKPHWASNLIQAVENKNAEENTPLS